MPRLHSVNTLIILAAALALLGGCAGNKAKPTSWESTRVIDVEV